MRVVITWFICCIAAFRVYSAQEATIPAQLNGLLPKIQAGMTTSQVVGVLSRSYKGVTSRLGNWSGTSGYIDYDLDGRFTLQVASLTQGGKDVVHPNLGFHVQDWKLKIRTDIVMYPSQEATIPAQLNGLLPKIQAGMTTSQVVGVLSQSYKDVTFQKGYWSGSSDYIDYNLDARFTLQVSSSTQGGQDVVHPSLRFAVQDGELRTRTEIVFYNWGE